MAQEKFYITTAIDYVNGPPHIGHALEKVQADVLARHWRARFRAGRVKFAAGTDEHGIKIARSAAAAGKSPQALADENYSKFAALKSLLDLSWDEFIRTSDKARHWPGAEKLWRKLVEKGKIEKRTYRGLYCVGHEAFVTKKDLVDGVCLDHQSKPEEIEEENYFFRLSDFSEDIGGRIRSGELRIVPEARAHEILSLIDAGLEDVSFSRSRAAFDWGIPVPGDPSQTMYVWCDALASYVSAIGYGRDETAFERWWPADVHVIGKDIIRFHAALWPGMLLAAGLPLPKAIFAHGFVSVEGQKMAKTIGNVVDPFCLMDRYAAKIGRSSTTDALRYYLLREIPAAEDGDFSYRKFEDRYIGDLANGLGNFAARVLALGSGVGTFPRAAAPSRDIVSAVDNARSAVYVKTEAFKFHEALAALWDLISFGDRYVNETKAWSVEDKAKKIQAVFDLVVALDNVAALLAPFLPGTAGKITEAINWGGGSLRVNKIGILFPKLF